MTALDGRTTARGGLLEALRDPATWKHRTLPDWDLLVRQARRDKLLGRFAALWEERGRPADVPAPVRAHLEAARNIADSHEQSIRWEVDRIAFALRDLDVPLVLLKGAAYVLARLPVARGRITADVDILVPKPRIRDVERALLAHGWEAVKLDDYDQMYYRRWMHELPPLCHRDRNTWVDVHHTILPETSRLHPDPAELLAHAQPLPDVAASALAPPDMVLHSMAHLFYDGSFDGGLRDLFDLDGLLRHFGAEPAFWDELAARARVLDLERPLFYALRYLVRLLATPVPPAAAAAAEAGRPARVALACMDRLVPQALLPEHPDHPRRAAARARFVLYVRSHWLRMPPLLLARHLATKAWKRASPTREEE